ncbi:MAG: 16S rRNA (adenine(1518)-N(6)/adenine(1519)-N(6))-dimethyltransferase RsmA [Promethearchaeota archaeon]
MPTEGLLKQTQSWLRTHGITISKTLGQHFLINEQVLARTLDYADLNPTDTILEIGAGIGTLTRALANHVRHVYAIEKDSVLFDALQKEFEGITNITLIRGDAVKVEWPATNKLVANLPFGISSPVLFKFLSSEIQTALLMLQREFAERLTASAGSKTYGRLTVMATYTATSEILEYVAPNCFHPPPEVTSALVRIRRCVEPAFTVMDYSLFTRLVVVLFNQRRKKIRTPLTALLREMELKPNTIEEIKCQIPWLDHRAEELNPEELAEIANIIYQVKPD